MTDLAEQTMDAAELKFWRERHRLAMDERTFLTGLTLREIIAEVRAEALRSLSDWPKSEGHNQGTSNV